MLRLLQERENLDGKYLSLGKIEGYEEMAVQQN